ncbi:MAG: hypothetical protein ACFHWX_09745 [Bacteroidota bacterium]
MSVLNQFNSTDNMSDNFQKSLINPLDNCFFVIDHELSITKNHYQKHFQYEKELLAHIDSHLTKLNKLIVHLDYNMFSANTIVFLLSVIKKLKEYQSKGKEIKMLWVNGNSSCKIEMNGISLLGYRD